MTSKVAFPSYLQMPAIDRRSGWRDRAACQGMDLNLFFVEYGPNQREANQAAKRVCENCPVRAECLRENLHVPYGTWGGLTRNERARLRKKVNRISREREERRRERAGAVRP